MHGWQVAVRSIVEVMQIGIRICSGCCIALWCISVDGDMSAEEPTRAPMATIYRYARDAHMDSTVPCINALQKCRSGCVANINYLELPLDCILVLL